MIETIEFIKDAADFPVVSWTEARSFGRPERIECRIMKTAEGELTFVARGHVRLGQFEEGRPWEMLQGFAIKSAEELYQGQAEQALHRHFANKSPVLGALLRDGGKVLVATFRIGMPVHLNCADAPQGEMERLHAVLSEAFMHGSQAARAAGWRCGKDDTRIETYDPDRKGWPDKQSAKTTMARLWSGLANIGLAAATLGMLAFLVYLVLMLAGVIKG